MAEVDLQTATIAPGQTVSGPASLGNKVLVGIQTPPGWLAATLSMEASLDGGATFPPVLTLAGPAWVTGTIPAGEQYVAIDPTPLRGISELQLVSSASQTAGAVLTLVTRLVP